MFKTPFIKEGSIFDLYFTLPQILFGYQNEESIMKKIRDINAPQGLSMFHFEKCVRTAGEGT